MKRGVGVAVTELSDLELVKQAVLTQGRALGNDILKVDSFLNHQLDVDLLNAIGRIFYEKFGHLAIDKIMTAEVSGIAIATIAAQYFNVPVVFAKKTISKNLDPETWEGTVYSYTKKQTYQIRVSKRYLHQGEKVLILDDFLANGEAIKGMKQIIDNAGAEMAGAGVVIEKSFQPGASLLNHLGISVEPIIQVESLANENIVLK